jgi:hypothetical protein
MRSHLVLFAVPAILSCGPSSSGLEPRFVAVHNAMTAMGLAQTGAISEGSLPEGAEARIPVTLEGGECYTFVALGSSQVENLDLRVLDEDGDEITRDSTIDAQSAAQACPERSGEYRVVVRMTDGQGSYTATIWSGGARSAGGGSSGGTSDHGTCADPIDLALGQPTHGTTAGAGASLRGSCANGGAPERVYRVQVDRRAQLNAVLQSGYDGALYLLRTCSAQAEIVCNDDNPDTTRSQIDATVEPGTYFVVVDGYGEESGEFDLLVSLTELQSIASVCSDATALPVGQQVAGTTVGGANYFQATCASGAQSPDRVYRLDVGSRSRVRVRQESSHDGALYIRRGCEDATTEIACNDDYRDQQHSVIATIVESGQYYVYADGFSTGQAGTFNLQADVTSDTGGGTAGDSCTAPAAAVQGPGQPDTFDARDDYAGSCGGQGSPDVVYSVNVRARSRLRATVNVSEYQPVLYLQSACGDTTREVACINTATPNVTSLEAVVQPGNYFLVVDGPRPNAFGQTDIDLQFDDLAALDRACRSAPMLRPGRVVNGTTMNGQDRFQASCAGNARSNDVVYRIRLTRRQIVRITMTSDYDGALHLRRDCADGTSEIACNDDQPDNRHSFIEQTLDPGTYFVVVDGFAQGNLGTYTLDLQTANP